MKPIPTGRRTLLATLVTAILGLVVGLSAPSVSAAEKGAERLHNLTRLATVGDLEALKKGDPFVMVCTKCRTVMMHTVSKSKGRDVPTLTARHLCPGCRSTIEMVGQGKGATRMVKHTCSGCGDESVFCCGPAGAGKATTGMEKH